MGAIDQMKIKALSKQLGVTESTIKDLINAVASKVDGVGTKVDGLTSKKGKVFFKPLATPYNDTSSPGCLLSVSGKGRVLGVYGVPSNSSSTNAAYYRILADNRNILHAKMSVRNSESDYRFGLLMSDWELKKMKRYTSTSYLSYSCFCGSNKMYYTVCNHSVFADLQILNDGQYIDCTSFCSLAASNPYLYYPDGLYFEKSFEFCASRTFSTSSTLYSIVVYEIFD